MRRALLSVLLVALYLTTARGDDPVADDPLPEGARARLGTTRLRFVDGGGAASGLPTVLTPDGKFLAAPAAGAVVFFEADTGKRARGVAAGGGTPVAFSADGKRGVNFGLDGVTVWDVATARTIAFVKSAGQGREAGVSLSGDGTRLAGGGSHLDKEKGTTTTVRDVDANTVVATVKPLQNEVVNVALSRDGKRLATWGYHLDRAAKAPPPPPEADPARTVQFWDAATGKETGRAHVPGVYRPATLALSPDGTLAAVSAGDGTVHLFGPADGAAKGVLLGRARQGARLAFSPDGRTLAAAGIDGSIQRWNVADGKRLGTTEAPVPVQYPRGLVYTDDGRVVAWSSHHRTALVWEAPSGKLLSPPGGHADRVQSIAVSGDGSEVTTASADGRIIRWDAATGKERGAIALRPPGGPSAPRFIHLAPDGRRAVALEVDGAHGVYDLPGGAQAFVIPRTGNYYGRCEFTPDGTKLLQVLTGFDAGKPLPPRVAVYDVDSGRRLGDVELPNLDTVMAAVAAGGKVLVAAGTRRDGGGKGPTFLVSRWELPGGKKLGEFADEGGSFGYVAAAGDKAVLVATPKGKLALHDATTGEKVRDLEFVPGALVGAPPAVTRDGRTAAVLVGGVFGPRPTKKVVVIDLDTGKARKTLGGVSGTTDVVALSPDGRTLVTGGHDTTAVVWDVSK